MATKRLRQLAGTAVTVAIDAAPFRGIPQLPAALTFIRRFA